MTRRIYKYPLPRAGLMATLPRGVKPKYVAWQDGIATLWAEVDTDKSRSAYTSVYCIGTGWDIPADTEYVGTLVDGGGFVWHWYVL